MDDERCVVCGIETGLCCHYCQAAVCANCPCPNGDDQEVNDG